MRNGNIMIFARENNGCRETRFFETFEAREAAFNAAVGRLIPGRYRGAHYFWRDFSKLAEDLDAVRTRVPAYITSNPRDCLAFGTAEQVLAAASMSAGPGGADPDRRMEEITVQFGLENVGRQPIRSLSGGETVRLALAKAMLAATGTEQLVIASPFCWLSQHHLPLLEKVAAAYAAMDKPVRILAMSDEDSQAPMAAGWLSPADQAPLPFELAFEGLHIQLGMPVNALTAKPVLAGVADFHQTLASPCLVTGDNGQGKSVLAKALCGAAVARGLARIGGANPSGRARLLFQDVVTQTLLRSPAQMAAESSRVNGHDAEEICGAVLEDVANRIALHGRMRETPARGEPTMLAVKAMLVAVRLAALPSALILDEPDWGFARDTAIAFVLAVVRQCHELGVPVMLISHKPWWAPMAGSMLAVAKTAPLCDLDLFGIAVKRE